jgi:GTPase
MVLTAAASEPTGCLEFDAEMVVLHHPTTIACRYQVMVHCGAVRQTAAIMTMDCEHARTGDTVRGRFRFVRHPEFLQEGARVVFREGRTKAVGTIMAVYPLPSAGRPAKTGAA